MSHQEEINNIRFPMINIRKTSNLAEAPINTFCLAIGLFMFAAPLMGWCSFTSTTFGVALSCGAVCQYIMGIYDWYQQKTILCFTDFMFSFLHALLCYFSYKSQNGFKIEEFQNAMIGTFFVLYLVALCVLAFAYKNQGLIHLIYLGLLIVADVLFIAWEYLHKKDQDKLKKAAGYFIFFACLGLWYSGVGRFINEIFASKDINGNTNKVLIPFASLNI